MPEIKVNGKPMTAPPGKRLLTVLIENGVVVPFYCYHPGLDPAGNCRMCLVKVSTSRKLEVACMIVPSEGLEVTTEGPEVEAGRKGVLEYMLANHPLDCPICDKAGECMLQDHTYNHRHGVSRFEEDKVIKGTWDLGPNIRIWGNRCIACTRCVRFTEDIVGTGELSIVNRGDHSVADTHPEIPLDNPMSLCTVDLCPVGALIDKNFMYQARVWFADRKETICTGCSRGCNVTATTYQGEIKRLQPRENADVNQHWMCDAGRLGIGHVKAERRIRQFKGSVGAIAKALKDASGQVAIVASTSHTLEELYLVKKLGDGLKAKVAFLGKNVGERWVAKSGFAIETDKTSNTKGAQAVFGALPPVSDVAKAIEAGQVKALLVLNQIPDFEWPADLVAAAKKVPFVAVADLLDGPIAQAAQVVVPSAAWAEKDGVIVNRDGRFQRMRPVLAPTGGAVADVAWLQDLLVALGLRKGIVSAEGVFREAFPGLDYAKVGASGLVPTAAPADAPPASLGAK